MGKYTYVVIGISWYDTPNYSVVEMPYGIAQFETKQKAENFAKKYALSADSPIHITRFDTKLDAEEIKRLFKNRF